ncbi:MAG: glycosyltransferase family 4 protein [Alphaproteobacteria bacterium]
MRIAMVARAFFPRVVGGMERFVTNLATHLQALGVRTDVVTAARPAAPPDGPWPFGVVELPWPRSRLYARSYLTFIDAAARHAAVSGYDAVYWQGAAVRGIPGVPAVLNVQGLEPFKEHRWRSLLTNLPLVWNMRRQARRMDRVISEGGHLTAEVMRFLGVPRERIVEIPNAVDIEYIDARLAAARAQAPPAAAPTLRLLYVGRLTANKGVDVLCRALRHRPLPSGAEVVLVGTGPEASRLSALAEGLPVRFVGGVSEETLFAWYAHADAFVFPTRYEGMPTVVLEAMAAGLPIIATDIGAVPTMVSAENGWLTPAGDAAGLATALRALAEAGEARRRALGNASRRIVERRYTWAVVARTTLDLLTRVVDGSARCHA